MSRAQKQKKALLSIDAGTSEWVDAGRIHAENEALLKKVRELEAENLHLKATNKKSLKINFHLIAAMKAIYDKATVQKVKKSLGLK